MELNEEKRLLQLKKYENIGQQFFDQIIEYYNNEEVLDNNDIIERKNTTLRFKYARRQYLLELSYNNKNGYGQILVYTARKGTEFWDNPEFIIKENSQIFFDISGNIYFNSIAHQYPNKCAGDIIKETTK